MKSQYIDQWNIDILFNEERNIIHKHTIIEQI